MRQPRVFVGRAFVIPPREVAHGEWRPPPGSSRPDGRSELHRQPDREPAGADRPDANPRWGLDCPPMLAPDNRTDDRAQDHPGGHRDDKQPAYQAATSPAGDDRGEYAERRPAEEAKGDAATPMSAAACARAPADLEPRPALARESHRRAVRTSHDDGGAVDRFETPGPQSRHPSGAVTRTRVPANTAGVFWAPSGPTLIRAGGSTGLQCSPPTTAPTIVPRTAPAGTVTTKANPHNSRQLLLRTQTKPAGMPSAAPPRKPRAMQPPRRAPPLHAPGPQLTSSCVPLSRGKATVVPFARRTTMVALSIASRLPGPTSRHPSGAVTRTRTPGARAGVSWAPRAPSGKPSASAKQEQMRFMGHLPPERTVGPSQAGFKSGHL